VFVSRWRYKSGPLKLIGFVKKINESYVHNYLPEVVKCHTLYSRGVSLLLSETSLKQTATERKMSKFNWLVKTNSQVECHLNHASYCSVLLSLLVSNEHSKDFT